MKKNWWVLILFSITGIALATPLVRFYISLPHQTQAPNLCVPTSASMIIEYYGDRQSPEHIKALAQAESGDPNFTGTHYHDMISGLKKLGYFWEMRELDVDTLEFQPSIALIENEIINHHPPMVDINPHKEVGANLHGHTMAVVGFDNDSKEIIFNDPARKNNYVRRMTFTEFQQCWNSARDKRARVIMLTRPKGDSTLVSN